MSAKDFLGQFGKDLEKMKAQSGDMVGAFGNLFAKTMGEGVLTVKQKELIALGIAVSEQCEPCIMLHVKKCLEAGLTKEEMIEACGVSVLMSGGPAYTHVPMVMNAIEELIS